MTGVLLLPGGSIYNENFRRESYMLKYMLETEAKGSLSLLNIDWFDDPFNYKLLVGTGSVGETKPVTVDLIETFNWLLSLRVRHMDAFYDKGTGGEGTWEKKIKFVVVDGINPKGEKVLVIWRKIGDLSETDTSSMGSSLLLTHHEVVFYFLNLFS